MIINWNDYMDITPLPPNRFQQEINDKIQKRLLESIRMNNNPNHFEYQIHRCFFNDWIVLKEYKMKYLMR